MVTQTTNRRSPGEGSVYQLKNGKWVAVLDLGIGVSGKRNRSTKTTTSKVLASRALREMQIKHKQNDLLSNQRKTLNQIASQWIEFGISEKVRQSTANGYIDIYDRYIKPFLGHRPITEIGVNEIDAWLLHLKSKGFSASTRKKARQTCNTIFKFAIRKRYALQNPVLDSQVPANEPGFKTRVQPPLTLSEAQAYLEYFKNTDLDLLIHLALFTGMRRGEIIGLNWSDTNFDELTLSINRTAKETTSKRSDGTSKTELVLNPPKTAHSNRKIPIEKEVLLALKRQQSKQRKQKLKAGAAWQETDAVFTTDFGTRSFPSNIYKRYVTLHKGSCLRYVRPHDLRHTVAVLGLDAEMPVEVISRLLGHSTISVTMDIYGKSVQSLVNRGAEGISSLFRDSEMKLSQTGVKGAR
jgi:integrase